MRETETLRDIRALLLINLAKSKRIRVDLARSDADLETTNDERGEMIALNLEYAMELAVQELKLHRPMIDRLTT